MELPPDDGGLDLGDAPLFQHQRALALHLAHALPALPPSSPCPWIDGVKGLRRPFLEFPKTDIQHVSANLVVGAFQHGTPALCVQDLPRFQDSR